MRLAEFNPNTISGCENIIKWSRRVGLGALAGGAALLGADALLEFIPPKGQVAIIVSSALTAVECGSIAASAERWRGQIEQAGQQGSGTV